MKMTCRTQYVLLLIALAVGMAHSEWDIVVSHGKQLDFYNGQKKWQTVYLGYDVTALTYDETNNIVFYVNRDTNNDLICPYDISAIEHKLCADISGSNIHDLTFDPGSKAVFYTDTIGRKIGWVEFVDIKTENVTVIGNTVVNIDHGIPTDIAVDSCRRHVYWINTNLPTPTIERVRFNGSDREVVRKLKAVPINESFQMEPHSLRIDQLTLKLYWIEPENTTQYSVFYSDLNGNNKYELCVIDYEANTNPLFNTLSISDTSLFWTVWGNINIRIEKFSKIEFVDKTLLELNINNEIVPVAANYEIKQRLQDLKTCEARTSQKQKLSEVPFCVHGEKVDGQSLCKCTPGYIGERCDVSICEIYCIHGSCSVNDDGDPECRCNAGYSGARCEVSECHGFCLNNGNCSLSEAKEPSCVCPAGYEGSRCEADQNEKCI